LQRSLIALQNDLVLQDATDADENGALKLELTLPVYFNDHRLEMWPCELHDQLRLFGDKLTFQEWMLSDPEMAADVPTPLNWPPESFPCIIKPRKGCSGHGVKILFEQEDMPRNASEKSHVLQEYIFSDEFHVAHVLCEHGEILEALGHHARKTEAFDLKRGAIKNPTRTQLSPAELGVFQKILRKAKYHGPCDIDFDYTSSGQIKIFEINPRFG
jgi:carbamoylphosphate synthase large subunit